jgi:hypothetical protein
MTRNFLVLLPYHNRGYFYQPKKIEVMRISGFATFMSIQQYFGDCIFTTARYGRHHFREKADRDFFKRLFVLLFL